MQAAWERSRNNIRKQQVRDHPRWQQVKLAHGLAAHLILMDLPVLRQLAEARLVEVEQRRQFLWGAAGEVLRGEGIDGEVVDPEVPAPAHDLPDLLLATVVARVLRQPTGQGEATVAVHDDGDVRGDRAVLHPRG